ncbi:RIBOSOME BIOGENESIS PROTEIN BOP1 BLOCK OF PROLIFERATION 1 PROTEIN [Salix purpurea]|uniref:RIBOSOME BIOGENESIS PROTEIN BOP1 BLOCK OF PROLIFERATION 1 PROTEIN n=1 Tax=Salix purpurea TaxID=77065 RepID=A0A9Q0QI07_SALPP|nr:RIBOSOME BIOGENESIS PROTEIN BOP1 BLOCK OF PROLIFERATION 1 PROTEIN [Salix purpurea]
MMLLRIINQQRSQRLATANPLEMRYMGFHNTGSNEGLANEGQSEGSEPDQGGEESDSSEDEVAPRNTVGDVPLEWYRDEKHIGYDIAGKKLKKKKDKINLIHFLQMLTIQKIGEFSYCIHVFLMSILINDNEILTPYSSLVIKVFPLNYALVAAS